MKFRSYAVLAAAAVSLGASGVCLAQLEKNAVQRGDRCYQETVKAVGGIRPERLTIAPCTRALKAQPLSLENKSAILHNQGIVQQAKGDLKGAKTSFYRSVQLARKVDKRNLALAQTALATADYTLAIEQYDLLIASQVLESELQAVVLRNRDRAKQAQQLRQVAAATVPGS